MFGWPIIGKGRFIPAHMQSKKLKLFIHFLALNVKSKNQA